MLTKILQWFVSASKITRVVVGIGIGVVVAFFVKLFGSKPPATERPTIPTMTPAEGARAKEQVRQDSQERMQKIAGEAGKMHERIMKGGGKS